MTRSQVVRIAFVVPFVVLLGAPGLVAAQRSWTVAPFVGANTSLQSDPVLAGATVAYALGAFGLRGGIGVEKWWGGAGEVRSGAWTADLDARVAWRTSSGLAPSLFAGIGLEGARDVTDDMRTSPGWSAGGGLGYAPFSWLRLESELRYRMPFGDPASSIDPIADGGLEYRAGIAVVIRSSPRGGTRPAPVVARDARWPAPRTADERAAVAARIIDTADDYVGTRYLWGGSSPGTGFDCSGFLQYVFMHHGLHLPRVSQDQARVGERVSHDPRDWQVGDLLFFAGDGRNVDHAALYAGSGRIIHSSDSGRGVRYDDLSSNRGDWYRRHLVGVRRVL